ncbi:cytochrome C [Polyangium mundeleinium]|uniref:Cytochrome C n=1 Tax=Polyangium mundeleinium TaxID=2995306 RepID=A0ABT5EVH9_9BACT|nr:cytochrome C [Polyangium mundeleinium]MDC0745828.1 cytochrome C [Polyangium mundeleinium]
MQWRHFITLGFVGLLLSCASEEMGTGDPGEAPAPLDPRVVIGLRFAPVPLNLENADRALVGLGSYFVNAASGCVDCHSCPTYRPGESPFTGGRGRLDAAHYLAGGVPFGQNLKAPSLAPDAKGLPGGLTREQFMSVMRTGKDPENPERILKIMPWALYRIMADEDLLAMYEYLRAIPPAQPGACTGPGQ